MSVPEESMVSENNTLVVAIVGRPNVGKSTLFNVLTKSNDALVYDKPGVTRDRIFGQGRFFGSDSEYKNLDYIVIDTGGINGNEQGIDAAMAEQALKAADECDIILWIVDARAGLTPVDEHIAAQLRCLDKPIHIVANKIDGLNPDLALADFYALGMGVPYPVSASNRRGVAHLVDEIFDPYPAQNIEALNVDDLETTDIDEDNNKKPLQDGKIRVAVIGRPNVGKSTLINRMLGDERVVVYDQPGTTIDSIYVPFTRYDREYILIDTAGVRRRGKVTEVIEKFSIVKTLKAVRDANVVILLVDSTEQLVDQDLHLLSYAKEQGKSLIIACNKWDGLKLEQKESVKSELERRLMFVDYAKKFFISAKYGSNVGNLWDTINQCYDSAMQDFSTSKLSGLLERAIEQHQPPLVRGRRIKMRYAHLGSNYPFSIVIHGKQTDVLPEHYKKYLANFFQDALKITATPVLLIFKKDDNPFAGIRNKLTPRQQHKRDRIVKHRKSMKK
jgi:GTP-binding protein